MYNFLTYKVKYKLTDKVMYPDGHSAVFSCVQPLDARYNTLTGMYEFEFQPRESLCINGIASSNAMDVWMEQIGQLIYPFRVVTERQGSIKGIEDFKLLKERWDKAMNQLLNEYKQSVYVSNYADMSAKAFTDDALFFNRLMRNLFFQYFFADLDPIRFSLHNFPFADDEMEMTLLSCHDMLLGKNYEVEYEDALKGSIQIDKDKYGVLQQATASYRQEMPDGNCYRRDVLVHPVAGSIKISKRSWLTF